ncbi:hypothetical protein PGT21_000038 [Puccinia graminis f. sp. tritici]|uniref:Uncharacterized protein n=1 Tax=Puccinia graminis f. sp. tritici TaxID=56615 RepID=A0A5B0PDH6_PUCGR|nr:hypothetical protein PGT21_000038 [Puccinia graminis f. sp. tritici]
MSLATDQWNPTQISNVITTNIAVNPVQCFPISSHHFHNAAAARKKELPVSDDDPPDDDPPEALTIEKTVLTLSRHCPLTPYRHQMHHSSSHNVPITPQAGRKTLNPDCQVPMKILQKNESSIRNRHILLTPLVTLLPTMPLPAENASNPDRSSHNLPTTTHPAKRLQFHTHLVTMCQCRPTRGKSFKSREMLQIQTDLVLTYRQRHTQRERLQFQPSSDNVPISTHPAEKSFKSRSSSPHEVYHKEKPLFHPESPLSITICLSRRKCFKSRPVYLTYQQQQTPRKDFKSRVI